MKMKKLLLLTLPLLLTACPGGVGPGASVVNVTASPDQLVTVNNTTTSGTTNFTFTNKAGSSAVTIDSATLTWTDAAGAPKTQTVAIPGFTLPAGFTCAAAGADPYSQCNYNDAGTTAADRSVTRAINDAELFAGVFTANPNVKDLPVTVRFNSTANAMNFTFTSQVTDPGGGTVTEAPKPVVIVNNASYTADPSKPISNTLSVTVSANAASGVGVKQLILELTDSKGIVTTLNVNDQESYTFNVDTTRYPDGALKLRAIAIDKQDRRGETTAVTTVQIANQVSPTIRVTSPTANAEVTGITPIVVQFQQNNTAFSFVNNTATIEVVDSGDRVITVQQAPIVQVNEGLWEARSEVDLNAPQYVNGTYTIRAKTDIRLTGAAANTTITSSSTFLNKSKVDEAPALNIMMPAYYGGSNTLRPILTRKSAVFVQVSDSNKVNQINLRFVCNAAEVMPGQNCNTNVYSYNVPVGVAGIQYRLFNTGILMDGEPYLPDGYYTMRATATDETGLSSFREMKVEVNRAKHGIANLGYNLASTFEITTSKLTPAGANWTLQGTTLNDTRVVELFYSSADEGLAREVPSAVGINTQLAAGSVISSGDVVFPEVGTYATAFLVQDLTTGVIEFYDGSNITATSKQ